ncbi:MAG: hypothetical protein ACXWEV_07340, partial [Methylobacter sp.]
IRRLRSFSQPQVCQTYARFDEYDTKLQETYPYISWISRPAKAVRKVPGILTIRGFVLVRLRHRKNIRVEHAFMPNIRHCPTDDDQPTDKAPAGPALCLPWLR